MAKSPSRREYERKLLAQGQKKTYGDILKDMEAESVNEFLGSAQRVQKELTESVNEFLGSAQRVQKELTEATKKQTGATKKQTDATSKGLSKWRDYAVVLAGVIGGFKQLFSWIKNLTGEFISQQQQAVRLSRSLKLVYGSRAGLGQLKRLVNELTFLGDLTREEAVEMMRLAIHSGVAEDELANFTRAAAGLKMYVGSGTQAVRYLTRAILGDSKGLDRYIPKLRGVADETERLRILNIALARSYQQMIAEGDSASRVFGDFWQHISDVSAEVFGPYVTAVQTLINKLNKYVEKTDEASKATKAFLDLHPFVGTDSESFSRTGVPDKAGSTDVKSHAQGKSIRPSFKSGEDLWKSISLAGSPELKTAMANKITLGQIADNTKQTAEAVDRLNQSAEKQRTETAGRNRREKQPESERGW